MTPPALHDAGKPAPLQLGRMEDERLAEHADPFNADSGREGRWPFCETPTALDIFNLVRWCRDNRQMGLLIGAPGVGKTTALHRFAEHQRDVRMVTMNPTARALNPALGHIARELGRYAPDRARDAWSSIVGALRYGGFNATPLTLILDEAQHLSDETIDTIRTIHDEADAGVVLCGNSHFRTRFNNARAGFGQVTSQIGMRLILKQPTASDLDMISAFYGVDQAEPRRVIGRIATQAGGLRKVRNAITMARMLAGDGAAITAKHLVEADLILEGRE